MNLFLYLPVIKTFFSYFKAYVYIIIIITILHQNCPYSSLHFLWHMIKWFTHKSHPLSAAPLPFTVLF